MLSLPIGEIQIKATTRYQFLPTRIAIIKDIMTAVGKDAKWDSYTAGENVICCSTSTKSFSNFSIVRVTLWPDSFISRYIQKRSENVCTHIWITKMMITAKHPPTDKWINKVWSNHTIQNYLAIKTNEILVYAITWINLESIILSERSQPQRSTCYRMSSVWKVQNR